jgi:hypothetical protein
MRTGKIESYARAEPPWLDAVTPSLVRPTQLRHQSRCGVNFELPTCLMPRVEPLRIRLLLSHLAAYEQIQSAKELTIMHCTRIMLFDSGREVTKR